MKSKTLKNNSGSTSINMSSHTLTTNDFGFSAVDVEPLAENNSKYTLVTLVVDASYSVDSFKPEMEKCIKEVLKACHRSQWADQLLVRLCVFDHSFHEYHGFKLIKDCTLQNYDNLLNNYGGSTALYDSTENAVRATAKYAADLYAQDLDVNAIVIIITDGVNNTGKMTTTSVKQALLDAVKDEKMESLLSILVAVNLQSPDEKRMLDKFYQEAGITQFVDIGDATPQKLAKLARFVSESISSQSQALGTGGASQPLTF